MKTKLLDRKSILTIDDIKTEDVDVPEWGGMVRLRMLTGLERDGFGKTLIGKDGKADMTGYRVKLLAFSIVGEDGKPLFTPDDIEALGAKSAAVIEKLFNAAERLSLMGAGDVEAAAKN